LELRLLLRREDVETLVRLRNLIDDLLETVEVMSDEELVWEIEDAFEDVRKGRLTDWQEFLRELETEETQQ